MKPIGLYLHIPFCVSKCPYCDFYSFATDEQTMEAYTEALIRELRRWRERVDTPADTLYLGGGTPSLLGGKRLYRLVTAAREDFGLEDAEITLEANPAERLEDTFSAFAAAGGNRISMGLQAGDDRTLAALGRRHTVAQAEMACEAARKAGIRRLSLDLMLGLEGQTPADVQHSVDVIDVLGATHGSAYLLKIEEGTPFASRSLHLPDDDQAAELYLTAVEAFTKRGLAQYEISNFAREGEQSRHNLKYWNADPTLGIGAAAHSYLGGKRLAYSRDAAAFIRGNTPVEETDSDAAPAGSETEYAMLRLRLCEGLTEHGFATRFGKPIPALWRQRAAKLPPAYVVADNDGIRLTPAGFLVSNAVLTHIL